MKQSLGGVICSMMFMAWVVFIRRCGKAGSICLRASSSIREAVSVGPCLPETMGHIEGGVLWALYRKYILWHLKSSGLHLIFL